MSFRAAVLLASAVTSLWARHLPIQVFTSAQGLPRNSVECLAPGPNGFLWICTSEGLVRFDGYRFRVFGTSDGLPSRTIVDFVPSRSGGFWVVTDRGVCRLPPGAKIGEPCNLLPVDRPGGQFTTHCLLESVAGPTWIATTTGLFRLSSDGRKLERTVFELPPHVTIRTLADGLDGTVLAGTDAGLFEWKPGMPARNLSESVGMMGVAQMLRVAPDEIWVSGGKYLFRLILRPGTREIWKEPVDGQAGPIASLRRHDGTVWTAGSSGIGRLAIATDGRVHEKERYTVADGLPSSDINLLVEDSQGNLWGAAEGAGIFRIADSGFVSYFENDGLGNPRIASIFEDRTGRLCVQTTWRGGDPDILVKEGDRFHSIPIRHPASLIYFGWGWNQYIVPAREGDWWVSAGHGMLRFPKLARAEDLARTPPTFYGVDSPLGCSEVFRAAEDSTGDIWISCLVPNRSLTRWQRSSGQFRHWSAAEGWPEEAVANVIREGADGVLWIGTGDAAARFRNGRFQVFPLIGGRTPPVVRDLLIDHSGRIWLATRHAGVFRCDNPGDPNPVFRSYTTREGLSSDTTSSLAEDREGFVYAGTARGVDRIDPRAALDSRRIHHFTAADGLPESEQNTAFRDRQGHLWFGTLNGLAEFDPSKALPQAPPEVYVTRVRVRGDDLALPWEGTRNLSVRLTSDRNQVEIEYVGLDFRVPGSLRYQYRLTGMDSQWSDAVEQRSVNYASLPRGPLQFEVRAVDSEGQLSPQAAGIQLFVQVPLWLRWWFLAGMAALIAAATAGLFQYRVRQLVAMERLRTRIATDLHDDMGTSLSQISILSELARRGTTPQVLADIAEIARGMAGDMSDIVWAINPRHDHFDVLVHRMRRFAEDTLGGRGIELQFGASLLAGDSIVPLEIRRPLYLIFKEAVNNAARHSGGTKASIRLDLDRRSLKLTVEDNGHGFDTKKLYEGEGLASMALRIRDIGGTAEWDSTEEAGTRFTATLPLRNRGALHELGGRLRGQRR